MVNGFEETCKLEDRNILLSNLRRISRYRDMLRLLIFDCGLDNVQKRGRKYYESIGSFNHFRTRRNVGVNGDSIKSLTVSPIISLLDRALRAKIMRNVAY